MSLTIGEVLENAEHNLSGQYDFQREIGMNQLINANYLLNELGKSVDDEFNADDLPCKKQESK